VKVYASASWRLYMTTVQDFCDERIRLPSPPAIAIKILQAVSQDDNSFKELAEIVMADPALVARIMKLAKLFTLWTIQACGFACSGNGPNWHSKS